MYDRMRRLILTLKILGMLNQKTEIGNYGRIAAYAVGYSIMFLDLSQGYGLRELESFVYSIMRPVKEEKH